MRKHLSSLLAFLLVFSLFVPMADAATKDVTVVIDGQIQVYDQPAIVHNGRTLVPMRGVFETLGAKINWDQATKMVTGTKGSTTIKLVLGSKNAYVNGKVIVLDVPADSLNGRTMVPLRFVSEALGASVEWDSASYTATINSSEGKVDSKGDLNAHFMDVGQGDSTLLILPNGKTILIDAGTQTAGQKVVSYLKKAGISSIDLFVLTHPHADHIGGAVEVMNNLDVKKIVDSGVTTTSQIYLNYLKYIDENNIPFEVAKAGSKITLDPNVSITVINQGNEKWGLNDSSVALRVVYNKVSILLTGDAEQAAERYMVDNFDVAANIYKVGHHGSKTSSNQFFLDKVKPEVAIISYGAENSYGHPHSEVIQRLKGIGTEIYGTAKSGNIIVTTNGVTYDINAQPIDNGSGGSDTTDIYPININTADKETLQLITGVGPVIAESIINYRKKNGPFKKIDDIKNVSGIGDSRFEAMKHQITVG